MRPLCIRTPATPKRAGAFFGRRKGNPLRAPGRRVLMATSAAALGVALQSVCTARSVGLVRRIRPIEVRARNRLRRRRASDRAGRAQSGLRIHRRRALPQRHGQGACRDRSEGSAQYPAASWRRDRPARLAPGGSARSRRPALSRSLAEAAALEAALRAGSQRRGDRARAEAGRRSSASPPTFPTTPPGRWSGCCARPTLTGPRSAPTTGAQPWPDFERDALRGQGRARRSHALLSRFSAQKASAKSSARRAQAAGRHLPEPHDALGGRFRQLVEIGERRVDADAPCCAAAEPAASRSMPRAPSARNNPRPCTGSGSDPAGRRSSVDRPHRPAPTYSVDKRRDGIVDRRTTRAISASLRLVQFAGLWPSP